MTPVVQHINPPGLHSNSAYTNVAVVTGNIKTIYVGGQNAVDVEGKVVGAGDIRAQTEQSFKNLRTALQAAGADLHDIIKFNIYIVQGQDLRPGFEVYQQVWGKHPNPPLITGVFVVGLANPEFLIEIEAVAVIPA